MIKFSTETWTLIVTKYHVCWLNWTNATPFRLHGPISSPHLHVLCWSWPLGLSGLVGIIKQGSLCRYGSRTILAGRLCLVRFEHFSFQLVEDKASAELTCSICRRFWLFWNLTVTRSSSSTTIAMVLSSAIGWA